MTAPGDVQGNEGVRKVPVTRGQLIVRPGYPPVNALRASDSLGVATDQAAKTAALHKSDREQR
jgi:hypothetical protein